MLLITINATHTHTKKILEQLQRLRLARKSKKLKAQGHLPSRAVEVQDAGRLASKQLSMETPETATTTTDTHLQEKQGVFPRTYPHPPTGKKAGKTHSYSPKQAKATSPTGTSCHKHQIPVPHISFLQQAAINEFETAALITGVAMVTSKHTPLAQCYCRKQNRIRWYLKSKEKSGSWQCLFQGPCYQKKLRDAFARACQCMRHTYLCPSKRVIMAYHFKKNLAVWKKYFSLQMT